MKTIRVTGKGCIQVKPDLTRITLSLEGIYPEYQETLKRSSQDTEQLKDLLTEFHLKRSDLKTLYFNIDPEYESYKERGTYKNRLVGYKFSHTMKVEFESDHERLGKILYALAHCSLHPEIRLSYTIKDQEASKNALLHQAIIDAKAKAVVLTQAADVTLKEIQSIDYSWGEINFEVHPMRQMMLSDALSPMDMNAGGSYDLDIEPDDLEVTDTVTVIWEIG